MRQHTYAAAYIFRVTRQTNFRAYLRVAVKLALRMTVPKGAPDPEMMRLYVSALVPVAVDPATVELIPPVTRRRSRRATLPGHCAPNRSDAVHDTTFRAIEAAPAVP